jgi:UDP-glucose 4-epimerase
MILVTGGMGFIGLHAVRSLIDLGEQVLITKYRTTRLPSFLVEEVGKSLHIVPLDLRDKAAVTAVLRANSIRSVLHLAAPSRSNVTPVQGLVESTSATLGLMQAAIEAGVERVTAASSLAVYFGQGSTEGPYHETMPLPLAAGHPIEADKKIDELIGAFLTASGALRVTRARIGGIWGPCYHSMMNAPSRLALLALGRSDELEGRPDPLRAHPEDRMDMMYVRDGGRALAALHTAPSLPHDVYNVSIGGATRYQDLIDAFNRAAPNAHLALKPVDRPPVVKANDYMSNQRLRQDLGFEPNYSLDDAVADYVRWLKDNRQ